MREEWFAYLIGTNKSMYPYPSLLVKLFVGDGVGEEAWKDVVVTGAEIKKKA